MKSRPLSTFIELLTQKLVKRLRNDNLCKTNDPYITAFKNGKNVQNCSFI